MISRERDLSLKAVCSSGEEAVATPEVIDVWLMDLRMSGMGGREACAELLKADPPPKVLFLTSFPEENVVTSLRTGASGYMFKVESPENILAAVRAVEAGLGIGSRSAVEALLDESGAPDVRGVASDELDERIVGLLLEGYSNHEWPVRSTCLNPVSRSASTSSCGGQEPPRVPCSWRGFMAPGEPQTLSRRLSGGRCRRKRRSRVLKFPGAGQA